MRVSQCFVMLCLLQLMVHSDGKYHALYEDLSTASPSPAETAAASPSSSKTPTEESYFAAWTQNLSPTRTTLASESPSVDPVITWIPIARRVEAPQKTIVMSQPPSTLAFQSFTPTTTIPVSSPTKSPAKNPSVASNSANSSSMPPMSVYPSDLAPQNGSEGLYQSSLPSEELVMRPSRSPTSTMTRTSHPSAVVPTNPEESSIHPSDYPSEKPSDYVPLGSIHPTSMPLGNESTNRLPSNQATISNESSRPSSSNDRPSKTPSPSIFFPISPSNQPSALEHVRVDPTSIEPSTGQRQLIGNVNATISSVTGTMGDSAVALFEKTVLSFLTDRFPQLVGFDIDFQNVDVQRQVFHHDNRRLQDGNRTGDLAVFFMVVAFFYPEMPKGFDFQWSMESFFAANSDQLSSQLETLDLVFHTDRIEGSGIEENSMDIEENQNSLADFFTRTVIVGTSFTIAAVLLIGAFVMSRMWRSQEGHRMESPGRLGALPSYDSEDRILGRRSSSDELNPSDPQSVFLSFSQLSRLDQKPSVNRTFTSELGPKSVGSVNNSSTNGSHLVSPCATIGRCPLQCNSLLLVVI